MPLALAAGAATLVQAVTSFALSQVLGVAAQRAITDMRRQVEAHVARLPVRYFDSTQTGVLISRIMTDAEGIRNLVGTGLVQLTGSVVTALVALGILFYLNWRLTLVDARRAGGVRRRDGAGVQAAAAAVPRARQDQRRGHRPAERDARRHPDRQDLHRREARGAGLHEGRPPAVPQRRASRSPASRPSRRSRRVVIGVDRRHHDRRRRPRDPRGHDDARRFRHVHPLHRPAWRRRSCRSRRSARRSAKRSPASIASASSWTMATEDDEDSTRDAARTIRRRGRVRGRDASSTTPACRC